MNELNKEREDFYAIIDELGLTSIDRWKVKSKWRGRTYMTYYIQFTDGTREFCISMNDHIPSYALSDGDGCRFFYYGISLDELKETIKKKCNR